MSEGLEVRCKKEREDPVMDPFNWRLFSPSLGSGPWHQSSSEPPSELEL